MTTRREFLVACSTAAAGITVVPEAALAKSAASAYPFTPLGLGHFAAQLRTTFRVNPKSAATVPLKLVKAEAYACLSGAIPAPDAANEKFSLLFRGPADQPLRQDTYVFDHKALGQFTMFIVPVGAQSADGTKFYQAVFNRPASKLVQTV